MALIQAVLEEEPKEEPETHRDGAGESFSVRAATAEDAQTLEDFYHVFDPPRAAQGLPPTGRKKIRRWLDAVLPRGIHLVAERGDELIGHALIVPHGRRGVGEYAVFVHQNQRSRGVGTSLTRSAIEAARTAGFEELWLSVESDNRAAIRAYEKAGFDVRPHTIYTSEAEMTLDLSH